MNLLVCDDIADRGNEVMARLRTAGQQGATPLMGEELSKQLKLLFGRVKAYRGNPTTYIHETSPFDDVDVLILDNNLTHLENGEGPPLTAESIVGYLRAFTTASYIVSLNMNPDVDFDLRYLVGDFTSRADLAVNTDHLENKALWTGKPDDAAKGFCPWYWPHLDTVADRRRKQIDVVKSHLDDSVFDTFGFDDAAMSFLSLHAQGALSPEADATASGQSGGKSLRAVTFREVFLAKDRSLPIKSEREQLSEQERSGNAAIRDLIARVVAADIDLWFRRDVVGPQEPLVDVPHLVTRFPFLLGDFAKDVSQWNKVVDSTTAPFGCNAELYDKHLAPALFKYDVWVQAACFWWPALKADEGLNEYFFRSKGGEWADVVFCEDESRFRDRSGSDGKSAPVEFAAEFEGAWSRRYVSRLEGVRYAPRTRLAV